MLKHTTKPKDINPGIKTKSQHSPRLLETNPKNFQNGLFPRLTFLISISFFFLFFSFPYIFFLVLSFPLFYLLDTWLNVNHSHMYTTCHAMCHPTPDASTSMKFRLFQNPTKFDGVTRFCETNSTVSPFRHLIYRKFPVFNRNYRSTLFLEKLNFS